jgi:hypothetical protein
VACRVARAIFDFDSEVMPPASRRSGTSTPVIDPRFKRFRIREGSLVNKFLAVITLLCLGACGGGGGGNGGGNVVMTPLSLADVTPAKGATGVQRAVAVVLTFSAPLDAATLSASGTTLAGPAGSQPVGLSAVGNRLTVTPSGNLSPLTPYTLTVGIGLRGSAGEQLAGSVTTSFTTGDRQWQMAVSIETGDVNIAEDPQIAVDSRGDTVVVWRRPEGNGARVWSNRYTAGSGWGTALTIGPVIDPGTQGPVRTPQVAMDANGNAIAVWPQSDGGNYKIWANRYTAGTGWGAAVSIEPNASTVASDISAAPQVRFDGNGNAIALWERSDGANSHVWGNRYTTGAGWSTAARVDATAVEAGSAQLAFDAQGDAIAVWDQSEGAGFHIWSSRYTAAAGSWSTARMIENDDAVQAFNAQIGIDTAGNAVVVWIQSDSTTRTEIWSNRYTAADGWGTAHAISDTAGGAGSAQLAMDANGDALVVWRQSDSNTSFSIRWNRYAMGGGWGTAAAIEPGDGAFVGDPQIACDSNGNALTVWEHQNGAHTEIRSSRYTVAGGWAAALNAGTTGDVLEPVIAMDSAGDGVAVWQQVDGANVGLVLANRFE